MVGRVVSQEPRGGRLRMTVGIAEVLKGPSEAGTRVVEVARPASDEPSPESALPETGDTVLLFYARPGDALLEPVGLRQALVGLGPRAATAQPALALLEEILVSLSGGEGASGRLEEALWGHVTIGVAPLRTAVLRELSERLGDSDGPRLRALAGRREAPEDARVWAIRHLGGTRRPIPPDWSVLLDPGEPASVREAALRALAPAAGPEGQLALQRALADEETALRLAAAESLTGRETVALLRARYPAEPERRVRSAILRRIGLEGSPAAREALRDIVARGGDEGNRREAEAWLASFGP